MDPYLEQRLRDEVLYLHSLWRQGPPSSSSSSNPNPNPNPNPRINPNPHPNLNSTYNPNFNSSYNANPNSSYNPAHSNRARPERNRIDPWQPDPNSRSDLNSINRKRPGSRRNEGERPTKKKPDPTPHSDRPWPCPSPAHNSSPPRTWPSMPTKLNSAAPPSPEEKSRHAALQLQHKASEACRVLFSGNNAGSDDEEPESAEEDGDDYWVDSAGESEEYKQLLNLFVEKSELRGYYEVNYESGEFCCLICCGLGLNKNKKKTVKGCVGLVQHSISILNTKRKRAHRAFAKVVCRVLGWDFDRLPTIVLKGERLGLSLEKSSQDRGEPEVNAGSGEAVSGCVEDIVAAENDTNAQLDEKENSLMKDDDTKKSAEISDQGVSETKTNKEAVLGEIDQSLISTSEWSCEESKVPFPAVSGWPTGSSHSASVTCSIPVEEEARSAALLLQKKALKECQDLFSEKEGSCSDEDNSKDDDAGDFMDEDESEESEKLKFFSKIFMEDDELRSFYENHYEGGEFFCLVCGGVGKKVWKRYKGCVPLLQHSTTIVKTKKKAAHRAYAQVICKVLGWDMGQPPTIRFKEKSLDYGPFEKSSKFQDGWAENCDHKNNVVSKEDLGSMSCHNGEIVSMEGSDVAQSNEKPKTSELQDELEANASDDKDNVVSKENLDYMSNYSGEIVSEESDIVQSKATSKICQLKVICNSTVHSLRKSCQVQDELQENANDHKNNVISKENLDSMSGHNREIFRKQKSNVMKSEETSNMCEFQAEMEDKTDEHKRNGVALKQNLDSRSDLSGEIVSKEESGVQSNETSKT